MKKEDKQEISLATTVKAVITGYVAYGILIGFAVYMAGIILNWCFKTLPNANDMLISTTIPLIEAIIIYFIVRGICKLSIFDVFKKCKTNPEHLPKAITRLNLFIMILIALYVVGSIIILTLDFGSKEKSIVVSSYQYETLYSEEFAGRLTNEMIADFEKEKENTIISTLIIELGMVISLFSVIPLQKKLITESNEF